MSMADFDWKKIVAGVAPALGAALGGPLAGQAVAAVAAALGLGAGASEDEVAAAVVGLTGEQRVALRRAELDFQIELERIDQAREAAGLQDTASARQQTVALAQADSGIAWAAPVISTVIVGGFFACVALLFIVERTWDERTANLLNVLFGALTVGFSQVGSYWLGSSAGSKRAGDAVRKIAEQAGAK
jgi:hypothetical protein